LQNAAEKLALSARGYHRVLKVSRTIADLEAENEILPAHVAEALRYRPIARQGGPTTDPIRA
jgi:magnesium chelatase family protein